MITLADRLVDIQARATARTRLLQAQHNDAIAADQQRAFIDMDPTTPEYSALVEATNRRLAAERRTRLDAIAREADRQLDAHIHLDFAATDAADTANAWRVAFFCLFVAAAVVTLILVPYYAANWQRITGAVACVEEVR